MPPRPHPLAVSRVALRANRAIERVWRSGLDEKPPLEPEYLWQIGSRGFADADEHGGRSEEDVADFRDRLNRLCTSLREEAQLNALGHTLAYGQLTAAIRKRHALGRLWRTQPDLRRTKIAPPIIVVGQMRSGTTRLHRLLAADPAHAGTRFSDAFDPVPRSPDWRPLKAAAALWIARRINPWLDGLHPFGATRPDEEIHWLSAALSPCAFEAQWHIPGYVRWSEARDAAPVYREFARILRTDAATRCNATRPRVIKCPQFSEDLAPLLDVFPGARVARARREPAAVLSSSISLVASQSAFQTDAADLDAISAEWRRKLALREARVDAVLGAQAARVAEVHFDRLDADWQSAMEQVYRDLALPFTEQALAAMMKEQTRASRSHHQSHAATLQRFAQRGS